MTPQEFQLVEKLVRALESNAAATVKLAQATDRLARAEEGKSGG